MAFYFSFLVKPNLKSIIEPNRTVGTIIMIICLLMWVPFFLQPDIKQTISPNEYLNFRNSIAINKFWALSITLLLSIFNGFLISTFIYLLRITKERSVFPICLYLLFIINVPGLNTQFETQLSLLIFIMAIYLFHKIYKIKTPVEEVFQITLLLSFGTWIMPESFLLFPILLIFLISQKKLSLRIFSSIIIGIIVAASFLFIYFYYSNTWNDFVLYARILFIVNSNSIALFTHFSLKDILFLLFFMIGLLSIAYYFTLSFLHTYHIRSTINNFTTIFLILAPFILLKINTFENLTVLWFAVLCTLSTNLFVQKTNWFCYILFHLYIIVQLAYYALQFLPYENWINIPYC